MFFLSAKWLHLNWLVIHFNGLSWILWFKFSEHVFENGQRLQYFIPAWMNLCLHISPGFPAQPWLSALLVCCWCVTVINGRRRAHWSWCGGREFCQSHLLREVKGHRQRNVVFIFWAKKFCKIIFPIFWCNAWRKIIIKQNWRREDYLPNDISPILSASSPRKRELENCRESVGSIPDLLVLLLINVTSKFVFWSMRG